MRDTAPDPESASHLCARVPRDQDGAAGRLHAVLCHWHAIDAVGGITLDDREHALALRTRHHVAAPGDLAAVQGCAGEAFQHHATMVGQVADANNIIDHALTQVVPIGLRVVRARVILEQLVEHHGLPTRP